MMRKLGWMRQANMRAGRFSDPVLRRSMLAALQRKRPARLAQAGRQIT
jgi:hypothetical protein